MSDDQRADTPPHDHEWVWHHDWWGAHVCGVDGCLAVRESPPVDAEAAAEPADSRAGKGESLAAEPPYLTLVAVQNALDEAWLESGDAQGQGRPPDLARHLLEALREYVAIEAEAAAEPAARGDFPNPPNEDPPDFPIPIEPPDEPAALVAAVRRMVEDGHPNDPDWFRIITEHLHKAESEPAAAEPPDPWCRVDEQHTHSGVTRYGPHLWTVDDASQPPRGSANASENSLPDDSDPIADRMLLNSRLTMALDEAGGSLTATEPPAVTALRELMEAMEACRVAGDESVKRAGSAKDAFGQSEDIMGPALDRLAAAEEQAHSILQDGSPRGVTVAADRPALDVLREIIVDTMLNDGPDDTVYTVADRIIARLGSEPTALPKSPEDSDG